MSEKTFPLERFYYGVFKGQEGSKPTVLARTSGITAEHVKECLLVARLAPPTVDQASEKMAASIGLFRGDQLDFVMTVAQINAAGVPQLLFVVLPREAMGWLAGNLQPFRSLGSLEMPVFEAARTEPLTPFILKDPRTATAKHQIKVMSNFLFYCQDNMTVAEGILTAIIRGQSLTITNAPPILEKRLNFIEGLISLLPPPARMRVTFATNVLRANDSLAHLQFTVNTDKLPDDRVVFDWEAGSLTPAEYERHDYPKFILAQLRLDPEHVIEHTTSLARTTAWRAMRKDSLQEALAWAAQRARIDTTVQTGQPADRDKVANILRQDPTLSDELRVSYAKHLLAMTLALKEWQQADIIPGIAAAHRDVAEAVFNQLRDAINSKRQAEALELIEHWMLNVAEAPALPWHQLWHLASWLELQKRLQAGDFQSAAEYIREISARGPLFKIDMVASQIILQTLKYAYQSPELAQSLLILAATHVPSGGFQQLVTDARLAEQLPPPLQKALAVLRQEANGDEKVQPEVLIKGVAALPSQYRPAVLAQLVEIALYLRKSELIDATVLQEILRLAQTEHRDRYRPLINYITEDFADFERVKQLGPTAWRLLPQLYFMGGYVEEGIYLIELYQSNLFKPSQSQHYIQLVGDIFLHSTLPADTLNTALEGFEQSRIWPDARVRAFTGALINQRWSAQMESAARRLTTHLFNHGELTRSISPDEILRLLQYHGERSNPLDMLRTASAIVDKALALGQEGPELLVKAWPQLSWQPEVGQAALELLRRYIRTVPSEVAQSLPAFFGEKLGKNVGDAIAATYRVRLAMGTDNLHAFAENLTVALKLLEEIATTYHPSKEMPPVHRLRQDMDAMPGNLDDEGRAHLITMLMECGQFIYEMGQAAGGRGRPSSDWSRERILEILPQNSVELLMWMGCYFAEEELPALDLERTAPAHILGNRSLPMFYDEMRVTHQLVSSLHRAYQATVPDFPVEALHAELNSLWEALSLYNQRQIKGTVTREAWTLGLLIPYMADRGNDRIFTDRGIGKKLENGKEQPSNGLEALRWIAGYFQRRHRV